jgi:hypothetical protein
LIASRLSKPRRQADEVFTKAAEIENGFGRTLLHINKAFDANEERVMSSGGARPWIAQAMIANGDPAYLER